MRRYFIPAFAVVDGAWNEWSYSDCSKSCGGGEQIRIRSCNAPEPQNGGNDCVGIHYEINSCNTGMVCLNFVLASCKITFEFCLAH